MFLKTIADHRWAGPLRMTVLYGLRRSELLALRWGGLDLSKGTMRISGGLVEASGKLLDRLLYRGVLPRYAFPSDVATFHVFDRDRSTRFRAIMHFRQHAQIAFSLMSSVLVLKFAARKKKPQLKRL